MTTKLLILLGFSLGINFIIMLLYMFGYLIIKGD